MIANEIAGQLAEATISEGDLVVFEDFAGREVGGWVKRIVGKFAIIQCSSEGINKGMIIPQELEEINRAV